MGGKVGDNHAFQRCGSKPVSASKSLNQGLFATRLPWSRSDKLAGPETLSMSSAQSGPQTSWDSEPDMH